MSIDSTTSAAFWASLALAIAAMLILARLRLRTTARVSFAIAIVLFAMAAAMPSLVLTRPPRVVVMVDYSASTRSADYRGRLNERLHQVLHPHPAQIIYFAEQNVASQPSDTTFDLPGDRTIFSAPPADVVVLFSDGHFDLPAVAPPVFVVLDDGLRNARDAQISHAHQRGDQFDVTIHNTGDIRSLLMGTTATSVPRGVRTYSVLVQSAATLTAQLNPADRWPENDALTVTPAATDESRWWIGDRTPDGFTQIDPATAMDAASMIGVSAIVIDSVRADEMADATMRSLDRYVRDLGGTLIINGGENAFASGGWTGTPVDAVSPLAASPPSPQRLWVILIDASGSMAGETATGTRLQLAVAAARGALHRLPPNDFAMIATFANQLSWLTPEPMVVSDLHEQELSLPEPRGPTNLSSALNAIIAMPTTTPRELLIITDGETADALDITPEQLGAVGMRPSVLLIGPRERAGPLSQFIERCAGTIIEQANPNQWIEAAQQLARVRQEARMLEGPFSFGMLLPIEASVPVVSKANQTWLRAGAAAAGSPLSTNTPAAALWQAGAGKVMAFAFESPPKVLASVADRLRAAPRDPRFQTRVMPGDDDIIQVTAVENGRSINDLQLSARDLGSAGNKMVQVGPGRYEIRTHRQPAARVVEISVNDAVIDRIAIAGRYAKEFDAIGSNIVNLRELAARTGGALIEPTQTTPIHLPQTTRRRPIAAWLAAMAAVLMAVGLIAQHNK